MNESLLLFGIHPDELAVFCRVFRRLRGIEQMAHGQGMRDQRLIALPAGEGAI